MSYLTDPQVTEVQLEEGGPRYRVNPAFDTVLEVQRLFREELPNQLKVAQALRMFGIRRPERLSVEKQAELLNLIYVQCVNGKKRPPVRNKCPVLDFEEDGEYIYASFFLDYGIDLIDMQGRLPWKKFLALFQGLSDRTKIKEVMKIRGMDIPDYNGRNQKQIQNIQELKSYYALPVRGGGGKNGLDALFSALEVQAVKGR